VFVLLLKNKIVLITFRGDYLTVSRSNSLQAI